MECREFENRLDAFLRGTMPPPEREAAGRHLVSCANCRRTHGAACGSIDLLPPDAAEELTRSILNRTSGSACGVAEDRICDWLDGRLTAEDEALVLLHQARCSGCRALARTLAELSASLPEMAMMEPDGAFTEDVLRLTAGLRQGSGTVSRARELRCWWVRLLARPRFAWEAAYLGALILLLAIGNPRLILDQFQARVPVPVRLVQTGESLIQGATGAFDEKQIAAERFFGNLRLQGRQLLDQAGVIRGRAAAAVLQGTSWLADTVRAAWPGETAAPK